MTHEAGIEAAAAAIIDAAPEGYGMRNGEACEYANTAIRAYLSASGMVLVPREPTDDMVYEAAYARPEIRTADFPIVYELMINAAPDPFKSKPDEIGRCGECKTEGWVKGELFPPCDDSYCTFSYWEPIKP